ncbi:MAG: spore germination protein [Oscillospiraceae bacterium]|nr:spore germination protein [Oscillospiraceae bacterium]
MKENLFEKFDPKQNISEDLKTTLVNFTEMVGDTSELVVKHAKIAGCNACIITAEGLINTMTISTLIYHPLTTLTTEHVDSEPLEPSELMEKVQSRLIAVEQNQAKTYEKLSLFFMSGFACILIDGVDYAIAVGVQGFSTRGVQRPLIHDNIRGSCEAFCEVLRFNISLVRRRIRSPNFVTKISTIGEYSKTDIAVCYFKDKVDPEMLKEVEERLEKIPISMILESGYVEPFLQDEGNSLFTQVGITDRPDSLAAKLYDGRIAVMVEGTPYVLFLPLLFTEHFQTVDDYTGLNIFTGFVRIVKYFAFLMCVLLPGFFVAATNFHPELFPPNILFNIINSEQKTPFTILAEAVIVIVIFKVMREAGLRLPSVVGHAVSIVGGLVLGDIVISVGLISAPIVLVVAFSVIASFIVPDLYPTIAVLRFGFVLAGGLFGLFGITALGVAVLFKVCSMSAYGVPYMAPLTPFTLRGMRDYFVRLDWYKLVKKDVNLNRMTGVSK